MGRLRSIQIEMNAPRGYPPRRGLSNAAHGIAAMRLRLASAPQCLRSRPHPITIARPPAGSRQELGSRACCSARPRGRAGAGVIVDPEVWVVTNLHVVVDVVDHAPRRGVEPPIVRARFLDGRELEA